MTKLGMASGAILLSLVSTSAVAGDDAALSYPPAGSYIYVNDSSNPLVKGGWDEADRKQWYTTSQGSRFIPLNWFQALEQENNTQPFLEQSHLDTLGFIPSNGPLPLGFSIDRWDKAAAHGSYSKPSKNPKVISEEWVGLTCAGCHTGQIKQGGQRYIIHGAPAMGDFMKFTDYTLAALAETFLNSEKYERFETKILGPNSDDQSRDELRTRVEEYINWRDAIQQKNGNVGTGHYGYGRLDAVGHILNKVSLVTKMNDSSEDPLQWPSDAPVSFPHLWNADQQALVQWNGLTANSAKPIKVTNIHTGEKFVTDIGALGRNTGEVTGVFGDFSVEPRKGSKSYKVKSSAKVSDLIHLERTLSQLPSPQWPFGGINEDSRKRGEELYKTHCLDCHSIVKPNDVKTKFPEMKAGGEAPKVVMNWIHEAGTDIWMACNTDQYGVDRDFDGALVNANQDPYSLGAYQLTQVVTGSIISQLKDVAKTILNDVFGKSSPEDHSKDLLKEDFEGALEGIDDRPHRKMAAAEDCLQKSQTAKDGRFVEIYAEKKAAYKAQNFLQKLFSKKKKKAMKAAKKKSKEFQLLRYKARPLNGIWATSPYLHNGSVPDLESLLMPSRHTDATGIAHFLDLSQNTAGNTAEAVKTLITNNSNESPSYRGPYRPDCFYVGNLEYNTDKAGYISEVGFTGKECGAANAQQNADFFRFNVTDRNGNIIPGNANTGHNYPKTPLSDEERKDLLEYLKKL